MPGRLKLMMNFTHSPSAQYLVCSVLEFSIPVLIHENLGWVDGAELDVPGTSAFTIKLAFSRFCSKWNTQPLYLSISYDDLHYLVTYCWFCMDFFLDKEQERSRVVGGWGGLSSCLQFNPEWESRSLATHPHPSREERDQISDKSSSWVQWQEKVMRPCRPIERVKWSIHWYELR